MPPKSYLFQAWYKGKIFSTLGIIQVVARRQYSSVIANSPRTTCQNENFNQLKVKVEELKMVMKDIVEAKMKNESNSDPMSNLNDF